MIRRILVWGLLLVGVSSFAQDLHYSQFYNSPLNVNPAKTGIFNGDKRFTASYKSQWRSVPVPWTTFSGSYDQKFYPKYGQSYFFSAGLLLNNDRQGELAAMNLSNINLTGSITKILSENNLLTLGLMIGYASRGLDTEQLTWDRQWDRDTRSFNSALPIGELFDTRRVSFFDNAIGLNYRLQKTSRTKMDIGLSMFHFINPGVAFLDNDNVKLGQRLTITGVGSTEISDKWDLQLDVLAQTQTDSRELIGSLLGKHHISEKRGDVRQIHFGLGYRSGQSIFPIVALQYGNFYLGASYDIDMTDFNKVHDTRRPTSFELHARYIITNVKPKVKVCPIY